MPPDVASLDRMYNTGDLVALSARIRQETTPAGVDLDLNWERARLLAGGGYIVAIYYFQDLWRVGAAAPTLKDTAAAIFLYATGLILVDGVKCADQSAPGRRLDQLFGLGREIVPYIQSADATMQKEYLDIAIKLESATAARRQNDAVICSGGMEEIAAELKAQGNKPLTEVPSPPGVPGRTVLLPKAPDYVPKFLSPSTWGPQQAAAKHNLAADLSTLLSSH